MQTNLETERLKASKREQEAFTAQYQLVGAQEEHQKALEQIKVLEEERNSLKTNLKEEEVARIAAEGRIALPPPKDEDDEDLLQSPVRSPFKSPRKLQQRIVNSSDSEKENVMPPKKSMMQLKSLQEELVAERRLRQKALDQIDFMKMECQFQCCSCRIAEQRGKHYVHDDNFVSEMERIKKEVPLPDDNMEVDTKDVAREVEQPVVEPDNKEDQVAPSPDPATFHTIDSIMDEAPAPVEKMSVRERRRQTGVKRHSSFRLSGSVKHSTPDIDESHTILQEEIFKVHETVHEEEPEPAIIVEQYDEDAEADEEEEEEDNSPPVNSTLRTRTPSTEAVFDPVTPAGYAVRTVTTTTTIPIQFSPEKTSREYINTALPATPQTIAHPPHYGMTNDENMPPQSPYSSGVFKADGTIDREAALELIRQRRGRARSMVLGQATPKKQMVEGNVRRDISAPVSKGGVKH